MTAAESVHVTAVFDRLDGSPPFERDVELIVRGDYVHMRGGPTGYESFPPAAYDGRDWWACVGTPGRWNQCVVPAAVLGPALALLGVHP